MKTALYYYTGTGNSLWVARQLSEKIGDTAIHAIVDQLAGPIETDAEAIGIVFPVHMWGVPRRVLHWVRQLGPHPQRYYFAVAVNAGQVSRTLLQLRDLLAKQDIVLSAGASCVMPSNYIPWGGPGSPAEQKKCFDATQVRLARLAETVRARHREALDQGPWWQRVVFTAVYHLSLNQVPMLDRGFWVDDRCNACRVCVQICPAANLTLVSGKPVWQHHCEQCLACIQWCPQQAIQYGQKTAAYERYHHPAIQLEDMLPKTRRSGQHEIRPREDQPKSQPRRRTV